VHYENKIAAGTNEVAVGSQRRAAELEPENRPGILGTEENLGQVKTRKSWAAQLSSQRKKSWL
jgi:hypothetical protein